MRTNDEELRLSVEANANHRRATAPSVSTGQLRLQYPRRFKTPDCAVTCNGRWFHVRENITGPVPRKKHKVIQLESENLDIGLNRRNNSNISTPTG